MNKLAIISAFLGGVRNRYMVYEEDRILEEKFRMASEIEGISGLELCYPADFENIELLKKLLTDYGFGVSSVNVRSRRTGKWWRGSFSSSSTEERKEVVEDFKRGELKEIYQADKLLDLGEALPPRWDIVDKSMYSPVDFIETTRGCPINCSFCAVTQFYGAKYRTKPVHLIEEMVARVRPVDKVFALKNLVFFVDDNIIANRKHCIELLNMLKSYKIQWVGQASVTVAKDDELLQLMSETRCLGLFIGMESLSEDALAECGKRVNKPAEYLRAVAKLHRHGIGVQAAFIVGFDNDDVSIFQKMEEFIRKSNFDSLFLSILTPYPGTRFYQNIESEGRLLHKDWERYDTSHVVFQPQKMTAEQLEEGFIWLYKKALSMKSIVFRLARARTNFQFFGPSNVAFRSCLLKTLKGR